MKKHFNNLENIVLLKYPERKIFSVHPIEFESCCVNKTKINSKFSCEMAVYSAVEALIKGGWIKVENAFSEVMFDVKDKEIIKKYVDVD